MECLQQVSIPIGKKGEIIGNFLSILRWRSKLWVNDLRQLLGGLIQSFVKDMSELIQSTPQGLYCPPGDFHIDPWRAVKTAVITHAHSDHARSGSQNYLCSQTGAPLLRARLGQDLPLRSLAFEEPLQLGEVTVSLHPAGHILGSAQVRVEHAGEVWVVSGDYKTLRDPSCEPFTPVPCDVFISECTFGLPIYRWPQPEAIITEIQDWWQANREAGQASVIFAYPLGKTQRLLAGLDDTQGPIGVYGNGGRLSDLYQESGYLKSQYRKVTQGNIKDFKGEGLLITPAMLQNTRPLRELGPSSLAFASGWMRLRGARRRNAVDRGFVLSDHADWDGLLWAIEESGAQRIGLTHGYTAPLARYLREQGKDVWELPTRFTGESLEAEKDEPVED